MRRDTTRGIAARLFVTVWLVYAVHFSSNVVRESYLAITLGEKLSVRVDEYMGLHPDLFEIPGRGAYINNNPGASMLGAIPYAVARPFLDALYRAKPELVSPKPPATYDDPRPNRTKFMNAARERGLDVKLVLAALVMQVGLMAPLGGLAAVLVFVFLRHRLGERRRSLWLALLFAFGTPFFFRSAFLNQNLLVAHCALGAYLLAVGLAPRSPQTLPSARELFGIGLLLGLAVLNDYTGIPLLVAFGLWLVVEAWRAAGAPAAGRAAAWVALGGLGPALLLFGYQWYAFGSPWYPAQRYMPATFLSVRGWNGFTPPDPELLWRNLIDLRYGLFAFSPVLAAALAAPFVRREPDGPTRRELVLIFASFVLLLVFVSSIQFAHLQWNTGVRYMVPAAPLLFFALVPVLRRMPRWLSAALVVATLTVSWCVSMTREDIPTAVMQVFLGGFTLPVLIVARKTASGYAPFLDQTGVSPLPIFVLVGVTLWLIWRGTSLDEPSPGVSAPDSALSGASERSRLPV